MTQAIWDACHKAQEAAALRQARTADREKSAALKLGRFEKNESGRWVTSCPGCGGEVRLYSAPNGHVRASSSNPTCAVVPKIQIRLRKWGFQ